MCVVVRMSIDREMFNTRLTQTDTGRGKEEEVEDGGGEVEVEDVAGGGEGEVGSVEGCGGNSEAVVLD